MKKKIVTLIALVLTLGIVSWGIYALVVAPRNAGISSALGIIK